MLPSTSATPTSFASSSVKYLVAQKPTLPNPWTIKLLPFNPGVTFKFLAIVGWFRSCLAQVKTPSPVDYCLPLIPPRFKYLPVVTAEEFISLWP